MACSGSGDSLQYRFRRAHVFCKTFCLVVIRVNFRFFTENATKAFKQ